jgi:hypothetical protein
LCLYVGARIRQSESGQATPEWVGLILLVSLLMASMAALGLRIPGVAIAGAIGERIVCAAGLGSSCGWAATPLASAYGEELAQMVASSVPELRYEKGMSSLPVDFRRCRQDACANGPGAGSVSESFEGEPVTAFTHVIDCRGPDLDPHFDCSGARAGTVYVQYWLYWPGSATSRALFGDRGFHDDDWESFQVKIASAETDSRASSHHGYNYGGGPANWLSDAGITSRPAWDRDLGSYYISGGSHAGHATDDGGRGRRWTPGNAIRLVPIESLDAEALATKFEIIPPWLKDVYSDPENEGT